MGIKPPLWVWILSIVIIVAGVLLLIVWYLFFQSNGKEIQSLRLDANQSSSDESIRLSGDIRLSTSSEFTNVSLRTREASIVEADLAAMDIDLDKQQWAYPPGVEVPNKKPRQIIIRLVNESQPWYGFYDSQSEQEIGSVGIVTGDQRVEILIYVASINSPSSAQWVLKLPLYALYALTHNWPTDPSKMIMQTNQRIAQYYGQGQREKTFYVE
jgi:hypothetical protein